MAGLAQLPFQSCSGGAQAKADSKLTGARDHRMKGLFRVQAKEYLARIQSQSFQSSYVRQVNAGFPDVFLIRSFLFTLTLFSVKRWVDLKKNVI